MKTRVMWHRIAAVVYIILMVKFAITGFDDISTMVAAGAALIATIYGSLFNQYAIKRKAAMDKVRELTRQAREQEDARILFEIEQERRLRNNIDVANKVA